MSAQVSENIKKRVRAYMSIIRRKAEAASSGTWFTKRQLGLASNPTVSAFASHVLRHMVEARVLEESRTDGTHSQKLYRPTSAGYTYLEHLDAVPLEELYVRFGRPFPRKQRKGGCDVCHGDVADRKSNAGICWGCEIASRRIAHGMDHVARTQAFLAKLSPGRRESELLRVAAAQHKRSGGTHVRPAAGEAPVIARKSVETRLDRPTCETPGCGRPIPPGGEGAPEICPTCLAALEKHEGGLLSTIVKRLSAMEERMSGIDRLVVATKNDVQAFARQVEDIRGNSWEGRDEHAGNGHDKTVDLAEVVSAVRTMQRMGLKL